MSGFSSLDSSCFSLPTFPQQHTHSVSLLKTQLIIGNKGRLFTFHIGLGFSLPKVVRRRSSFPPRCVMNILSALFQDNKNPQFWQNNGTICNYLVDMKRKGNSIGRCPILLFHDQGVKVCQVSISQFTTTGNICNNILKKQDWALMRKDLSVLSGFLLQQNGWMRTLMDRFLQVLWTSVALTE